MIISNIRKTALYMEMMEKYSKEELENIFGIADKKVLPNIDTLYVTVTLEDADYTQFNQMLSDLKAIDEDEVVLPHLDCKFRPYIGIKKYRYCFEYEEKFNIFFCQRRENDSFPTVYIQVRSVFLWKYGEHKALLEVKASLEKILIDFGLKIIKFQENRIDYAYHCNFIRDLDKFAYDLKYNSVSHFRRWSQEGTLGEFVETDYITLGRRKSNNIFVRVYNKSKEVIELGYKAFFFKIWKDNQLISNYDLYIHEKCVEHKSFYKMDYYRLIYYRDHGSNSDNLDLVSEIITNMSKYDNSYIRKVADRLTPKVTLITNFEYETKRKFYHSLDGIKGQLESVIDAPSGLKDIYKLLDNKHLIHDLLTTDVFRLVIEDKSIERKRDRPVSSTWKKIQDVQVNDRDLSKEERKLLRSYQRNLDINIVKRSIISNITSLSLYVNGDNKKDVVEDTLQFLNFLAENDWNKALEMKQKKAPAINARIEKLKKISTESRYDLIDKYEDSYSLLNLIDGTIIE